MDDFESSYLNYLGNLHNTPSQLEVCGTHTKHNEEDGNDLGTLGLFFTLDRHLVLTEIFSHYMVYQTQRIAHLGDSSHKIITAHLKSP